jgi:hypothetical protein
MLADGDASDTDVLLVDAAMRLGAISDVDPIWLRWSAMLDERGLLVGSDGPDAMVPRYLEGQAGHGG